MGLPPANRREHVIPALTDHMEDKGGVIGLEIEGRAGGFFKTPSGLLAAKLTQQVPTHLIGRRPLSYVRCNIHRDPPRLVAGEQLRRRSPAGLVLEVDVGERLAAAIAHDQTRRRLFDGRTGISHRLGLTRVDRLSESGNQMVDRTVNDRRRVGNGGASILRIPRVVGKMKLI
jgi:hypothetical protein